MPGQHATARESANENGSDNDFADDLSVSHGGGQQPMHPITVVSNGSSRSAYRVVPDPDDPVILILEGQLCRILDISATGFSCPQGEIKAGRRYSFKLDLPTAGPAIEGMVDVLPQNENSHLHCRFVDLAPEEMDSLHYYVLVRQKEAIRSLKKRSRSRR